MTRSLAQSGMFVGLITARSVSVPSPAASINYSIQIEGDTGVIEFDSVAPQDHYRLSTVFDIDLVPFDVGQRVPIGVSRFGASEFVDIMMGELPNVGDCS